MGYSWLDRRLLNAVHRFAGPVPVRVVIGSGSPDEETTSPPALPLVRFKDRRSLMSLLRNPGIQFGDLYSSGRIQVEGDLVRLIEALYAIPYSQMSRVISRLTSWIPSNSLRREPGTATPCTMWTRTAWKTGRGWRFPMATIILPIRL